MKKSVFILLLILIVISTQMAIAQDPPPPPGPGGSGPGNVDDVSITTFLWILTLAGAYLGFKKAK